MWNYRIYKGVEVAIEAVYTWLRQVIVFYIISTLFVNAVASDKYKEYIRIVTRMILIFIIISPLTGFWSNGSLIKSRLWMIYKDYMEISKKTSDVSESFSYTIEDALSQTVEMKVKEILKDNNIAYDSIKVNISGNTGLGGNENDESLAVSSVVIDVKNMKKSDIENIRHKISDETEIDFSDIYIK